MGYDRTHSFQKKKSLTPQPTTQFKTRPLAAPIQRKPDQPKTPDELENEAFNHNKFEAFGLQLKEQNGTITPVEQERLGVLQAKMDDFWVQRRERASLMSNDLSKIPVHPPEGYPTPQLQPMGWQGKNGEQREDDKEERNSPLQMSRLPIQAKLTIGEPGDKYEQEADAVAARVVEQIHAPATAQPTPGQSVQRKDEEESEEVRAKLENKSPKGKDESQSSNQTGLPDDLKAGVENLSAYSLDNVRVHYNSPKPAQLQALAYTQGTEIHVAPGQEEHLPHEAWHVVQQMQGRVKPTMQMKGVEINDDQGLETEADVMGAKALGSALLGAVDKGNINSEDRSALQLKSAVIQLQRKPRVTGTSKDSQKLRDIVNALFREHPADGVAIGDGSALAACSYEVNTGKLVGRADHQQKCYELWRGVDKLITRSTNPDVIQARNQLSPDDLKIATKLAQDLIAALAGIYKG